MLEFIAYHTPIFYLVQPLWRDEAFSVLLANHNPIEVIRLTASDFNPPFYYLLLSLWMKLFGSSEMVIRSLSFMAHLALVYVMYHLTRTLFPRSQKLPILASLLTLINPMLLYFGFEARMYSFLALFAALSLRALISQNWRWYVIWSVLGLYTQPFMLLVVIAQAAYILRFQKKDVRVYLGKLARIGLLYLPWMTVIAVQLTKTKAMWIEKADLNLITSALGNVFIGYEGTPGFVWLYTKILSLIMIVLSVLLFRLPKNKQQHRLILYSLYIPLVISLAVSLVKPVYVNRYVIFITVFEILVIVGWLSTLSAHMQRIMGGLLIAASMVFNSWYAPFHAKTDFRMILTEINQTISSESKVTSTILSQTPLSFFEISYYAEDKNKVFLYNPNNQDILPYLGSTLIPKERWMQTIPAGTVYFIHDDGTYTKIQH